MKAVPITTTSVEVFWEPVDEQYWSGDTKTGGYRVIFQPVSDFPTALQATPKEEVMGITVSTHFYIFFLYAIIYLKMFTIYESKKYMKYDSKAIIFCRQAKWF